MFDWFRIRWFLLASVVVLLPLQSARAIIVFEKGKDQPTIGRLVRQSEHLLVIEESFLGERTRQREIPMSQVEDLLISVSTDRLELLNPAKPHDYRDYAEELADKAKDPDAQAAAIRLYLIAAFLAPEELGRSCLLGMVPLARSDDEAKRFRAMAYLLDPNHDRGLLQESPQSARNVSLDEDAMDEGTRLLLRALQAFRRGDRRVAMMLAQRDIVKATLERHSDVLSYEQFTNAGREIPADLLRRVLLLELKLADGGKPNHEADSGAGVLWSRIVQREGVDPVGPLNLRNLTEFDPTKCVYHDGQWQQPAQTN